MQKIWILLFILSLMILIHQYFIEPSHIKNRRCVLAIKVDFLIKKLDNIGKLLVGPDITIKDYTYNQVTRISSLSVLNGKLKELSSELSYKNYHTTRSLNYIEEKIEKITKSIDIIYDDLVNKKTLPILASDYDGDKLNTLSIMSKDEKLVDFTVPLYKDVYDPVRRQTLNDIICKNKKFWYNIKRRFKRRD